MIAASGLSWWEARYSDGREVAEWDSIGGGNALLPTREGAAHSRWEEIDHTGLRSLRLICPDGRAGAITVKRDNALWQLKLGEVALFGGTGRRRVAHLIGGLTCDHLTNCPHGGGETVCWAWEDAEYEPVMVRTGNQASDGTWDLVPKMDAAGNVLMRRLHKPRLVGPFTDNVLNLKYRGIGPLSLDVQGLKL